MNIITDHEYWKECRSLAQSILEEALDSFDLDKPDSACERCGGTGENKCVSCGGKHSNSSKFICGDPCPCHLNNDNKYDSCEAVEEYLWESIDGHEWVIYTYYAQQVTILSPSQSYALENWGPESVVEDYGINWSQLAFGALYADVSEILWPLFDEKFNDEEE